MKVLLTGAAGPLGAQVVPRLELAGALVTGIAHTPAHAARLRDLGARHVRADLFEPESVRSAVLATSPDVIIHLATGDDRLCGVATRGLISAAQAAGTNRVIVRGAAYAYSPTERTCREQDPLYLDAPRPIRARFQALAELERAVLGTPGVDGLVLRFGTLYGPGTLYGARGQATGRIRRRRLPLVGKGRGWFGFVHVEDAADAVLASLREPRGVLNIVDDDPVQSSEWLPKFASAIGAKPPRWLPAGLAGASNGVALRYFFDQQPPVSNAAARDALDWVPRLRRPDLSLSV